MAYRVRTCRSLEELGRAVAAIGHYFGWVPTTEDVERFSKILAPERMHAAFDGKEIVGGAGAFTFEMTVPGGAPVPARASRSSGASLAPAPGVAHEDDARPARRRAGAG